MATSCGISAVYAQKASQVRSSPVFHAKEWGTWPIMEAKARCTWRRTTHGRARKKKAEIFRAQYPEHYTGEANTEVHPTIAGMIQNYNKKFFKLCIRNMCNLAGVKIYQLPSVNGFDSENGQLCTCNMFTLKQCSNNLFKMAHLLPTDMDKAYLEQLVNMLSTGVAAAVTKPEGGKSG